jgi:hypothetical protein
VAEDETTALEFPEIEEPPQTVSDAADDLQTLRAEWFSTVERLRAEFEAQLQEVRKESDAGWFVRRVEGLERENLALRLERDKAIARTEDSQGEALERLQAENAELLQKLKLVQDKLDSFRQLLNGDAQTDKPSVTPVALTHQDEIDRAIAPPESTTKPRGPKAGKAFRRAEAIVLAIKDWNRLYPSESFAINAAVLEMTFHIHRQAAKEFLDAYQNELWEYHQEIGVESPRWHNRGKDTEGLKKFVEQKLSG